MNSQYVIISIFIITILLFVPYLFTDKLKKHKVKYIPSFVYIILMFILYIKATFFRVGFSSITDIVLIIIISIAFIIYSIISLFIKVKK